MECKFCDRSAEWRWEDADGNASAVICQRCMDTMGIFSAEPLRQFTPIKDMAGWNAAKVELSKYLQVGDPVSEDMMTYFLEVLPPATWRPDLIQIGEPFDLVQGRATFATIIQLRGTWFYAGNCHRGKYTEPKGVRP